jgi:hypothetical protein
MKPAALALGLLLTVFAIAVAVFVITQNQTLADTRSVLETAVNNATAQADALEGLITQSAATSAAIAQSAAEQIDGIRGAAATLQAGSLATRSALQTSLNHARETATQAAQANMTAAARAQTRQAALEATAAAQANILIASASTIEAAATQANADAQTIGTAQAQAADQEDRINSIQTQVARLEAQLTQAPPDATASRLNEQPLSQVSVSTLIFSEAFGEDSQFPAREYPGIGQSRLERGQLVISFNDAPAEPAITVLSDTTVDDGLIEAEFTVESCPGNGLLLIEVRNNAASGGGYAAGVDCAFRSWGVFGRVGNSATLLGSNPIAPAVADISATHTIGVEMRGTGLTVYLDGLLLGSIEDPNYNDGAFGITVVSSGVATVRVDNLRVWSLGETQTPAVTPTTNVLDYDSQAERSTFLANLSRALEVGEWVWELVGDPRFGSSELALSTVSLQLREANGARAFVTVFFSDDQEILNSTAEDATQELQIQAFATQPDDFSEPSIFGLSSDGLDAVWAENGRLFRVTLIDVDRSSEAMLIALSRALRDRTTAD